MNNISVRELQEIMQDIYIDTVKLYLCNYRFNKYRLTHFTGNNARYMLRSDFLSLFYTYLLVRNKYNAAENLKKHFKIYKIKCLEWEDFICKS